MVFANENEAYEYAVYHGKQIESAGYTEYGFEVNFVGDNRVRQLSEEEWIASQPVWGIYAVTTNGGIMYKRDVDAMAKKTGLPKSKIQDTTFNIYEAKLWTKSEAETKAYFLRRNGRYDWQVKRLKY